MFDGRLNLQAEAAGEAALALCTVAPEGHQGLQARFEWEA
jgi:3-methylfumaryl-CoA hydratase